MHAFAEITGKLIENLAPGSRNGHRGALGVKNAGDGAADSAGRASHQRSLSGELEHLISSPSSARVYLSRAPL